MSDLEPRIAGKPVSNAPQASPQVGPRDELLDFSRFEVVDLVPVPCQGDRMIRLRTLEEAISDMESGPPDSSLLYLIRVRPRDLAASSAPAGAPGIASKEGFREAIRQFDSEETQGKTATPASASDSGSASAAEKIYLTEGKLNLPYLFHTAELLFESGEPSLARNVYKTILGSGERTAAALLGTARCLETEGKLDDARTSYEESIAYQPETASFQALARLLIRQGRDSQAGTLLERALQLRETPEKDRLELHRAAAECWQRASRPESAEKQLREALALSPAAEELHCALAELRLRAERVAEAEAGFEKALELNPASAQALSGLGSCALKSGNLIAAKAWFARSLKLDIRNPAALVQLVRCSYGLKSYGLAEGLVVEYLKTAPANVHLLYSLAGLRYHLRNFDGAGVTCNEILTLDADHAGARELLSRMGFAQPRAQSTTGSDMDGAQP